MATNFNVAEVQAAAADAMSGKSATKGLEAARKVYDATINDWTLSLESSGDVPSTPALVEKENAVVALWLAWIDLEKSKKQWKAAANKYDLATMCSIASKQATVWISYAEWCVERNKAEKAIKLYSKALETLQGEDMREQVLTSYLAFKQGAGGEPDLTMESLRAQVQPDVLLEKVQTPEELLQSKLAAAEREGAVIDVEAAATVSSASASASASASDTANDAPPPVESESTEAMDSSSGDAPTEAARKRKRPAGAEGGGDSGDADDDDGDDAPYSIHDEGVADLRLVKKEKLDGDGGAAAGGAGAGAEAAAAGDEQPGAVSEDEEEEEEGAMPAMLFDFSNAPVTWDQPFETHDAAVTAAVEELLASPQGAAVLDIVDAMRVMQALKKAELDDAWHLLMTGTGAAQGGAGGADAHELQRRLQDRNRRELAEVRATQQAVLAKAGIPLFVDSSSSSSSSSSSNDSSSSPIPRGKKKAIARQCAVVKAILVRKAQLERRASVAASTVQQLPQQAYTYNEPVIQPVIHHPPKPAAKPATKDHKKLLALLAGAKAKKGGMKK